MKENIKRRLGINGIGERRLGVNIDHIATLREARKEIYPDPFEAIPTLIECKASQVTLHLREDRRHIQNHDLERIAALGTIPVNMEMAAIDEMFGIAGRIKPHMVTLVPERRQEVTTEGGLDVKSVALVLDREIKKFKQNKIITSLFIDADETQVDLSVEVGAEAVEFHTGSYAHAFGGVNENAEFERLKKACLYASQKGLKVFAGHGLNLANLPRLVSINEIEEYNIGHSIIARAVTVGLRAAILEVQNILGS